MTLIITLATADKVVQASDRRLTLPDGSVFDDEANKAICAGCKDAHFCIAYTGLAFVEGKKTDEWLIDYLISIHAFKLDVVSISGALEEKLTATFDPLPKQYRRTTFVLSGYRRHISFTMIISNYERENLWPPGEAQDAFLTHVWWKKKGGNPESGYCISINGTQRAVSRPLLRKIKGLIRNSFFQNKGSEIVADELVSLIREAAETPQFGQYIGRNCMAVAMSLNANDGFVTKYYPEKISPYRYSPHLITPPGIAVKGIELWRGKGQPPWQSIHKR
jgi:hypothetical protein